MRGAGTHQASFVHFDASFVTTTCLSCQLAFCVFGLFEKSYYFRERTDFAHTRSRTKENVEGMHAKALELGGSDEGAPGARTGTFYGGYFRDLDGNKLVAFVM